MEHPAQEPATAAGPAAPEPPAPGVRSGRRLLDLVGPLLWLALGSTLLLATDADRVLAAGFAGEVRPGASLWPKERAFPFHALYEFGVWPALGVSLAASGVLLAMLFRPALGRWRRLALYWLSCLALGPGLIVNALLKDHYGRPRPRDVTEFGGEWAFEPLLQPDWTTPGKSFPNGHASMGFLFIAGYFALRRSRPMVARGVLVAALLYGCLIGVARLAAGGHFPTDTLWSGGVVWLVCAVLAALWKLDASPWSPVSESSRGKVAPWKVLGLGLLGLGVVFGGLLALPIAGEHRFGFTQAVDRASLELAGRDAVHTVSLAGEGWGVRGETRGHGLPGSGIKARDQVETKEDGTILFEYKERESGLAWELVHRTECVLPLALERMKITLGNAAGELRLDLAAANAEEELEVELVGECERLVVYPPPGWEVKVTLPGSSRTIPGSGPDAPVLELDLARWSGGGERHLSFVERVVR